MTPAVAGPERLRAAGPGPVGGPAAVRGPGLGAGAQRATAVVKGPASGQD